MYMERHYEVIDKYNNQYRCSWEWDDDYAQISLGAHHWQPCVTLVLDKDQDGISRFVLQYTIYHRDCAMDGLERGVRGTQSMIITALCIGKHLYPNVNEYVIQDNSQIDTQHGPVQLIKYSLLTKGQSWYQTFLRVKAKQNIERFGAKMKSLVNRTLEDISVGYGIPKHVLEPCYSNLVTWKDMHRCLLRKEPEMLVEAVLSNMVTFHSSPLFNRRLFGAELVGRFEDIDCGHVISMKESSVTIVTNVTHVEQTGGYAWKVFGTKMVGFGDL